jgi:hypothetical protein
MLPIIYVYVDPYIKRVNPPIELLEPIHATTGGASYLVQATLRKKSPV